jgi:hypothetical protein
VPAALEGQVQGLFPQLNQVLAAQSDLGKRLCDVEGHVNVLRGQITRRASIAYVGEHLSQVKNELSSQLAADALKAARDLATTKKGLAAEMRLAAKRADPRVDQLLAAVEAQAALVSALSAEVERLVGERTESAKAQLRADQANKPAEVEKPLATFAVEGVEPPPKDLSASQQESELTQPSDTA